jgi:hypothetical protein
MKKCRMKFGFTKMLAYGSVTLLGLLFKVHAFCQDGLAGINEANTKVRGYFSAGTNLMYAVGAIVGLIGAVKVFNKWTVNGRDKLARP